MTNEMENEGESGKLKIRVAEDLMELLDMMIRLERDKMHDLANLYDHGGLEWDDKLKVNEGIGKTVARIAGLIRERVRGEKSEMDESAGRKGVRGEGKEPFSNAFIENTCETILLAFPDEGN